MLLRQLEEFTRNHLHDARAVTRLECCVQCDRFEPTEFKCKECGCAMLLKVALPLVTCPKGKW